MVLERPPPDAGVLLPAEGAQPRAVTRSGSRGEPTSGLRRSHSTGVLDRSATLARLGQAAVQQETLGDYAGEETGVELNMVARGTA
jgi:hypothetical protein